jgi:hypothetical protein
MLTTQWMKQVLKDVKKKRTNMDKSDRLETKRV